MRWRNVSPSWSRDISKIHYRDSPALWAGPLKATSTFEAAKKIRQMQVHLKTLLCRRDDPSGSLPSRSFKVV